MPSKSVLIYVTLIIFVIIIIIIIIGASFFGWDARPHQPVEIRERHWNLDTSSAVVEFPPPYLNDECIDVSLDDGRK